MTLNETLGMRGRDANVEALDEITFCSGGPDLRWQGSHAAPGYDICPQNRSGNEANQAILIVDDDWMSRLATCIKAALSFQFDEAAADLIAPNPGVVGRGHRGSEAKRRLLT